MSLGIGFAEPQGDELDGNRRATHRSAAIGLACLAQDRQYLAFVAKQIAAWVALPRAVRFVWKFETPSS